MSDRKMIQPKAGEVLLALSQHPQRFTREELRRFEERGKDRTGRGATAPIASLNYTDIKRPYVFRCPIHCCGGDVINGASLDRALVPHFHQFHPLHRNSKKVYAFKAQSHGQKWRYFRLPSREGKGGGASSKGETQGDKGEIREGKREGV